MTDPTVEDILRNGNDQYKKHADIFDEDDEGYDADNVEQDRSEDFSIVDYEIKVEISEEEEENLYRQRDDFNTETDYIHYLVWQEGYTPTIC